MVKSGTTYTCYVDSTNRASGTLADIDVTELHFGERGDVVHRIDGPMAGVHVFDDAKNEAFIGALISTEGGGAPVSQNSALFQSFQ